LLTVCQEVKNFKFCVKILRFCDSSQDRSTAEPFQRNFWSGHKNWVFVVAKRNVSSSKKFY
jgi:hypothetical protein